MIALHEKDEYLAKLGGDPNRNAALESMRAKMAHFFSNQNLVDPKKKHPLKVLQAHIKQHVRQSHLAIAMVPLTLVYEEGSRLVDQHKYNMLMSLHLGSFSIVENLFNDPLRDEATDEVEILKFSQAPVDWCPVSGPSACQIATRPI